MDQLSPKAKREYFYKLHRRGCLSVGWVTEISEPRLNVAVYLASQNSDEAILLRSAALKLKKELNHPFFDETISFEGMSKTFLCINIGNYAPLTEIMRQGIPIEVLIVIFQNVLKAISEARIIANNNFAFTLDAVFVNAQLDVKFSTVGLLSGDRPSIDKYSTFQLRRIFFDWKLSPSLKDRYLEKNVFCPKYQRELEKFSRICSSRSPKYRDLVESDVNKMSFSDLGGEFASVHKSVVQSYPTDFPDSALAEIGWATLSD